jgi:UDP-N-acetylglucosamine diphosphorylase / glucose-1-phosphate thymidylyltransferase / UDP-N-acetylgalactosamine diphosphorylase / glucosamine-1-phosphate N-acetyltransferase / galactosamine-1-phosphate N-acetyltransferase
MLKLIFTEEYCKPQNLHPFTLIRHIQDLRVGILTIREKWEKMLGLTSYDKWEGYYLDDERSIKIDKSIGASSCIMIHANVLPTKKLVAKIKKLKHGEFLTTKNEGAVAYKFSEKEILSLHKIKMQRSVEYEAEVTAVHYPWQLFQLNDEEIRHDFELLTEKRKSKAVSKTNKLINPKQIFIEAGVKMEHCILNASTGPVYIGKNTTIMEGTFIRGPFAMCEGGLIKMGAKIYGATTLGPYCLAGGEIKNSVLMGYSNKAHDGYLGDSVIGEWCNLGAGTSNSNLKNNCGDVTYWVHADKKEISAGTKGGLLMGDYSRAAINTSFNTGAVVGVCCNVFAQGLTPKYIPHFSWGCDAITRYKLNSAIDDINKWKELKGFAITEKEKAVLAYIHKKF